MSHMARGTGTVRIVFQEPRLEPELPFCQNCIATPPACCRSLPGPSGPKCPGVSLGVSLGTPVASQGGCKNCTAIQGKSLLRGTIRTENRNRWSRSTSKPRPNRTGGTLILSDINLNFETNSLRINSRNSRWILPSNPQERRTISRNYAWNS